MSEYEQAMLKIAMAQTRLLVAIGYQTAGDMAKNQAISEIGDRLDAELQKMDEVWAVTGTVFDE